MVFRRHGPRPALIWACRRMSARQRGLERVEKHVAADVSRRRLNDWAIRWRELTFAATGSTELL